MIDFASYALFIAASTALILVPGPAQALVISRTVSGGVRVGMLTAVGLNIGTLFHACAAAFGLSAILATSAVAFALVKYAGAAYLLYLGIRALRSANAPVTVKPAGAASGGRVLREAIAVGVLNPKVAVFFLAFLPQFVDPARGNIVIQFLLLGFTMALLDTLYECALSWGTHRLRDTVFANPRYRAWQNRISGGVMIALGARLALQER